ncbi:hypothetical protein A5647_15560 [Mycobacterium sp. 1100029.7]|nr:hypothetical protein A5647_15560 [Mycobacterium sp. 1100029.7]
MINNRNSQAAIRSARVLDHHKWLRETLLQLGSHAAEHAFEIDRLYNTRSFATSDEVFTQNMLTLAGEIRRLSATADSLSLIGFPELAATCAGIRHAADRVVGPANTHRETIQSSAPAEHVQRTRAAVDTHLAALGEARKQFIAHAQSTLKAHALLQVEGV